MQLGGATTSQVIILPQEVTSSLNLKVSYNGQSYNAQLKLPATPTANFYTAGYAYTYIVTLNNKDIEVSTPQLTRGNPEIRTMQVQSCNPRTPLPRRMRQAGAAHRHDGATAAFAGGGSTKRKQIKNITI